MDITIVISNSEVKQDDSIKPSESFNPNLRKIYEKTKNARSLAELKGLCETCTPPWCEDVAREKLKHLELFINDPDFCKPDPIIKLALLHYQFESIHPFGDGKGRTGRILNSLYLLQQDLLSHPILFTLFFCMALREFFLIEPFKIFDCSPLQAENIVIELTEIFMAKAGKGNAGFDKCFHGKI